MTANINSMAYAGKRPWHGLGTKVESGMTSTDAIIKAGLDWRVEKLPIQFVSQGQVGEIPKRFATVRMDTMTPLGIVGPVYRVLQNKEAFSLSDAIVGIKEAFYHTVGSLGAGQKVWLLMKLPGSFWVTPEDEVNQFLLFVNSHDGSTAVTVAVTPIRVVCQNTLNVAIKKATAKFSIRHTISMGEKISEVREVLGLVNQHSMMFQEASRALATVSMTGKGFEGYVKSLGILPKKDDESTRAKNVMAELSRLFEVGRGADLKGSRGTAWGGFNAIVEWVDYYRGSDKSRTDSLLFGSGMNIKQTAIDTALGLVR
jgi:phage/plasmid-like protein (TIGR03299 family)